MKQGGGGDSHRLGAVARVRVQEETAAVARRPLQEQNKSETTGIGRLEV
jgi:hypothetical protein